MSPAKKRSNSDSPAEKRARSESDHSLPPKRYSAATGKNTFDSRYGGEDTPPYQTEKRPSWKSDVVIDTSRPIIRDGRINVLPAIDSPREPKIFNTQAHTMKRGSWADSVKLTPVRLPVVIDSEGRQAVSEEERIDPKKKRVGEDWRNQRHVQKKSIAEKRHLLRVAELAKERTDRLFFKTNG